MATAKTKRKETFKVNGEQLLAPTLAAIGATAALLTECKIVVEREE